MVDPYTFLEARILAHGPRALDVHCTGRVPPPLFNKNLYAAYGGMKSDNPAVYECPKGKNKLHTWKRNPDLTATCVHCKTSLSRQHADECFEDRS